MTLDQLYDVIGDLILTSLGNADALAQITDFLAHQTGSAAYWRAEAANLDRYDAIGGAKEGVACGFHTEAAATAELDKCERMLHEHVAAHTVTGGRHEEVN